MAQVTFVEYKFDNDAVGTVLSNNGVIPFNVGSDKAATIAAATNAAYALTNIVPNPTTTTHDVKFFTAKSFATATDVDDGDFVNPSEADDWFVKFISKVNLVGGTTDGAQITLGKNQAHIAGTWSDTLKNIVAAAGNGLSFNTHIFEIRLADAGGAPFNNSNLPTAGQKCFIQATSKVKVEVKCFNAAFGHYDSVGHIYLNEGKLYKNWELKQMIQDRTQSPVDSYIIIDGPPSFTVERGRGPIRYKRQEITEPSQVTLQIWPEIDGENPFAAKNWDVRQLNTRGDWAALFNEFATANFVGKHKTINVDGDDYTVSKDSNDISTMFGNTPQTYDPFEFYTRLKTANGYIKVTPVDPPTKNKTDIACTINDKGVYTFTIQDDPVTTINQVNKVDMESRINDALKNTVEWSDGRKPTVYNLEVKPGDLSISNGRWQANLTTFTSLNVTADGMSHKIRFDTSIFKTKADLSKEILRRIYPTQYTDNMILKATDVNKTLEYFCVEKLGKYVVKPGMTDEFVVKTGRALKYTVNKGGGETEEGTVDVMIPTGASEGEIKTEVDKVKLKVENLPLMNGNRKRLRVTSNPLMNAYDDNANIEIDQETRLSFTIDAANVVKNIIDNIDDFWINCEGLEWDNNVLPKLQTSASRGGLGTRVGEWNWIPSANQGKPPRYIMSNVTGPVNYKWLKGQTVPEVELKEEINIQAVKPVKVPSSASFAEFETKVKSTCAYKSYYEEVRVVEGEQDKWPLIQGQIVAPLPDSFNIGLEKVPIPIKVTFKSSKSTIVEVPGLNKGGTAKGVELKLKRANDVWVGRIDVTRSAQGAIQLEDGTTIPITSDTTIPVSFQNLGIGIRDGHNSMYRLDQEYMCYHLKKKQETSTGTHRSFKGKIKVFAGFKDNSEHVISDQFTLKRESGTLKGVWSEDGFKVGFDMPSADDDEFLVNIDDQYGDRPDVKVNGKEVKTAILEESWAERVVQIKNLPEHLTVTLKSLDTIPKPPSWRRPGGKNKFVVNVLPDSPNHWGELQLNSNMFEKTMIFKLKHADLMSDITLHIDKTTNKVNLITQQGSSATQVFETNNVKEAGTIFLYVGAGVVAILILGFMYAYKNKTKTSGVVDGNINYSYDKAEERVACVIWFLVASMVASLASVFKIASRRRRIRQSGYETTRDDGEIRDSLTVSGCKC